MDGGSTEDAGGGSFAGLGGLERWRTHLRIAVWCLVLCCSMLLNATLLVAFIRRPGLRTISNRFVMNLIASNLLTVLVLATLLIIESWGGPMNLCGPSEGATALVTISSILSVLLIGVDQYLAVVDPLRYRTRIDKLRCGLLILTAWLVALAFGAVASFNPQPRSLWRLCAASDAEEDTTNELSVQASLILNGNATESADLEILSEISLERGNATYGRVYALTYALLGYLAPVFAIIWIYVSIYKAARNNSERTRRTGSRPVLSPGSFCEEIPPLLPPLLSHPLEDARRVPKISSLSSIDESVEANSNGPIESQNMGDVEAAQTVVFTVGNRSRCHEDGAYEDADDNAKESTESTVPIIATMPVSDFLTHSANHHQRDSESAYGRMVLSCDKHRYEYDDELEDSSEEDEEEVRSTEKRNSEDGLGQPTGTLSVNFDLKEQDIGSQAISHPPMVTVTPPGQRPGAHKSLNAKNSHSYIEHLRYRISNGSLFKYREETRAARISALVIVMGLICWTPYVYVLVLRNLLDRDEEDVEPDEEIAPSIDAGAIGFLVLATYVSPLLFGYRSRRVKRELRKFFCFRRELSYRNNRSLMAKKVLRRRHSGVTMLGQLGVGVESTLDNTRYNILNCVYGRVRWPKDKVHFVQVPDTALAVETCRSSFSSGASTQISSTSTDEC